MKISRQELQRVIREEKARLRREDVRSASRKTKWVSGDAGKKSRANRLRRFDEQSTPAAGMTGMEIQPAIDAIEDILNGLNDDGLTNADLIRLLEDIIGSIEDGFVGEPS
tara:strand:- start:213 stop:542 length:330 start_codon:yes stop_codon:yes gene_type:complete